MPQAVDSNSTLVSGIHPAALIENLDELSQAFKACKVLLESAVETDCDLKAVSYGIGTMLDCLIARFDNKTLQVKKLIYAHVPPTLQGEIVIWPEGTRLAGAEQGLSVKTLRDKFIVEQMQQGISAEQISQAFNLRLSAIRRMIENLHAAQTAEQTAM